MFRREAKSLNLREADQVSGLLDEEGYCLSFKVGVKSGLLGPKITRITVSDDGLGPMGFYTRVIAWAENEPVWEGALCHLEGVHYITKERKTHERAA